MKKYLVLLIALLVAGPLLASNMGFKLNYTLHKTSGTTNTNWISLPYFWSGTVAQDVCTDIGATAVQIGEYDESTDSFISYVCGGGGTNFSLSAGRAIFVKVNTDGVQWIIVGSHNDAATVTLTKTSGTTNTNWIAIPYHTNVGDAQGLCTNIGGTAVQIGIYDESTDAFTSYVCGGGGTNFSLTAGQGVFVKVNTDGVIWTPSHY